MGQNVPSAAFISHETENLAKKNGFSLLPITTSYFHLISYTRIQSPGETLSIYIEGDGLAWLTKSRLSANPTPTHSLAFKLAAMDSSANVAYLARPCQYVRPEDEAHFDYKYWSSARFSEEVIASMNEAVDVLKHEAGASQVRLIGHSGGGAVVLLIAARRKDVESLATIAGSLDPEAVNRHHHVSPLTGSLNPVDVASRISGIPQEHLVGGKDPIVPPSIALGFFHASGDSPQIKITEVPDAHHETGWDDAWKEYLLRHRKGSAAAP